MTRLAKIISGVFHPLIMPFYAMVVMLYASPMNLFLLSRAKLILLLMTFVATFLIPLLFVKLLQNMKLVSSLNLRERKERLIPLLFGAFMCYVNYLFLIRIPRLPDLFPQLFFALAVFLVLLVFITRFWKISLHLSAMGGLLAITFTYSLFSWLFLVIIFCAGLVGTSRLWLKAHNSWQIYIGFLLGLCYFLAWFIF